MLNCGFMKSNVKLSGYAIALTWVILLVLTVCCVATFNETPMFWIVLGILVLLLLCGLLYAPSQIVADSNHVVVKSYLRRKSLPIHDIESIELFQPTMGALRLCASGGFFGYWGLFREGDIGRYAGYYGRASDCFLIRMKNGDKYVLGCENPAAMVEFIKEQTGR